MTTSTHLSEPFIIRIEANDTDGFHFNEELEADTFEEAVKVAAKRVIQIANNGESNFIAGDVYITHGQPGFGLLGTRFDIESAIGDTEEALLSDWALTREVTS